MVKVGSQLGSKYANGWEKTTNPLELDDESAIIGLAVATMKDL